MRVRQEEPVQPGEVVHGYRIERKLGAGGFGRVYLAWQGESPYALKFIRMEEAENWAKRELSILLYLRHANVVKLVGHVEGPEEAPEYLVLVMEYVRGRTLYDWAREENPSARQVAGVVLELCRALAVVHSAGVLHRDFKGDNVLVRDEDGEPVLVDFGVSAVPWAPRVTRDGLAPCTPFYRSPECVRFMVDPERPEDAPYPYAKADDLFALGVTLYVLLTGVYPFWGRDELDLMREIAKEVPRAPHERNRRVPEVLGELCMRLLEKEPQARIASAEALGEALEAMLAQADASWDEPLCAAPPGGRSASPSSEESPGHPVRALARGRLLWVGGVCCLLLVGLGSGYLLLAQGPEPDTEPSATPAPAGPVLASLLRAMFPDGERTSEACFVREVAPPWKPPEAGAGAAPPRADTPAPVVPVTTLREGGTRLKVKKQHKAGEKKGIGSDLARWCIGATAAATAACVGAQVRPMPEPEACPAGAVDVMTDRFDIPIRGTSPGLSLPGYDPSQFGKHEPTPVQEGPATLYLGAPWGKLPSKSYLSGRLIIGPERVYGRFTEVLLPSGERLPVCFALIDPEGKPGLPIEGTGEQGVVKAFPIVEVEAVRIFK